MDADVRALLEAQVAAMSASLDSVSRLLKRPTDAHPTPVASALPSTATPDTSDASNLVCLRDRLRCFAKQREWDQFHTPRNIALALVGEVGELCELFQWRGDAGAPEGLGCWDEKKRDALGDELADVLLYLVRLSDKCGVDLPAVTARKLSRNAAKYPADLVRGSSKKYNEYTRRDDDRSNPDRERDHHSTAE